MLKEVSYAAQYSSGGLSTWNVAKTAANESLISVPKQVIYAYVENTGGQVGQWLRDLSRRLQDPWFASHYYPTTLHHF